MPKSFISRVLVALLLTSAPTFAQSLADVLSSVQERKQAIEQRKQVEWHLIQVLQDPPPETDIPEQELIEWTGLGATKFPTDADTASLNIDARIALLNQAIQELRPLQRQFLNIRKQDIAASAKIGAMRPYLLEDFPDIGRVDASNYHAALKTAATSVRRLSVLDWPFAGFKKTCLLELPYDENSRPASIGPAPVDAESGAWEMSLSGLMLEECLLNKTPLLSETVNFYEKTALFAGVPNAENQLDGNIGVIVRNQWSPVDFSSITAVAPTSWNPNDSSCQVAIFQASPSGDNYSMGATPQITLQLGWLDGPPWSPGWPHPVGYQVEEPWGYFASDSWEWKFDFLSEHLSGGGPAYYVLGRRLHSLFTPTFTKGLDAAGKAANLAKAERVNAPPSGDAQPVLHPTPGILAAIPLGVGLDGGEIGMLGITNGDEYHLFNGERKSIISYSYDAPSNVFLYIPASPEAAPGYGELPSRFDFASNLRFIGPVQDFHVVYETAREVAKRGAALPDAFPTSTEETNLGCRFFFRNWDLPRIKQIVSRDFIVNITTQGHYKNQVKIYRRPLDSTIDRAPGVVAEVTGLTEIRTLIFDNPDAGANAYPNAKEKVHITDGSKTYKVWRSGYPVVDIYAPSVVPPDLNFEIHDGTAARSAKKLDFTGVGAVTITNHAETTLLSTETINDPNWFWYLGKQPIASTITSGSKTTTINNTFDGGLPVGSQAGWFPQSSVITTTNEPTTNLTWNASGRLVSAVQGSWKTDYSIEAGALKGESKFSDTTYASTWTEWSNNDRTIKTYSAPDGSVASKASDAVDSTELTLGNASGTGLPGLPHSLTRKDGSGSTWTWTVGNDFSGSVAVTADTQTTTTAWNNRNYTISSQTSFIANGTVIVSNHAVPAEQFTTWGAPTQWKDQQTNLASTVAYDAGLNRPSSVTSPLGLTTGFTNYDIFNRPGEVTSNGITATNTYTALTTTTTYGGTGVASGSESSYTTNIEGTNVNTGLTWGGVSQSQSAVRGASSTALTGTNSLLGSSSATVRNTDGSTSAADSPTLAFGGVAGDALSIVNGLLVTKSAVAGQTNTFAETHTDAWGRTRKIVTPSKSSGFTQTTFGFSNPDSSLKRVINTQPSGRVFITESEANGTINRSGIDVNGNDELGASDRYTQSVTTVDNGKVITTLSVTENSGMREVMKSEWTPASGITVTKLNGNEETITTTPDYGAKTVTTSSDKGWSRTNAINNLGLATNNTLSGTGISTTDLKPVWRADGSLESVELDITTGENQKETHTASFNPDGTLSSLTAPGRGNILGGHSISNGVENLTVDGVTTERALDGTSQSISGANVIGRSEALTTNGSGYKNTTTPAVGAATQTTFNSAAAPTSKTYADNTGHSINYAGELPFEISLARGGAVTLGYANNGAKDLTSAVWPAVTSGPFTIPSVGVGFGYNRSGNVDALSDPSGTRAINFLNGRTSGTTYTAGFLKSYEIIPGRDTLGRHTGTLIKRSGATIHTTAKALNGVSNQITNLASGNITATPQRDGAGRIIGYVWSDGTNSVSQTWARGAGGRINSAESNVPGAPSFNYSNGENTFDAFGRRLKSQTAGGTWTYTYGTGGQLSSATHPSLGSFNYSFDGIGRRTDKGEANSTDILNRTTAWTNSQNKTITIKAHPDARVWFNGIEIENFTGTHNAAVTPPGAEGGWVAWESLAILEGAGEGAGNPAPNPLANPDAKAEKKGAVWVPPTAETLTYDAAGNRQSSAQWDFGWDAKNQLTRARTKNHTTALQAYDLTFTYDSEGRRVKKHVVEYQNGTQVSEKIVTFVWDGWDLMYERHQLPSGLTTLERKYLWGPDIADGAAGGAGGLLLIRETKGNATTNIIPLYDGTGHVIALTDINKNLLASYAYGPFGEKISAEGTLAQSNPWRYATKYLDVETGLYYYGKRYMDPITGQFTSRDPAGESESINLYGYCSGEPINKVDVLGLAEVVTTSPSGNSVLVNDETTFWLIYNMMAEAGLVGKLDPNGGKPTFADAMVVAGKLGGTVKTYSKLFPGNASGENSPNDLWIMPFTVPHLPGSPGGHLDSFLIKSQATHLAQGNGFWLDAIDVRAIQAAGEATSSYPWGSLSKNEAYMLSDRGAVLAWLDTPLAPMGDGTGEYWGPEWGKWQPIGGRNGGLYDYAMADNPYGTLRSVRNMMAVELGTAGLAKGLGAFRTLANAPHSLNPNTIRFSQASVNGLDEIAESMRLNGWVGKPIDVVRMTDGTLTTFDNTRVLAARKAGINVRAIIHQAGEAFPAARWTPKNGIAIDNWEEAVLLRIQQQKRSFRMTYPNGSPLPPSIR